jgi:hypothetical protein
VNTAQETGGARLDEEPISARLDLLERDAELAVVETLIGDGAGRNRLLAIEGAPRDRQDLPDPGGANAGAAG